MVVIPLVHRKIEGNSLAYTQAGCNNQVLVAFEFRDVCLPPVGDGKFEVSMIYRVLGESDAYIVRPLAGENIPAILFGAHL
jgi:hypothetical protein